MDILISVGLIVVSTSVVAALNNCSKYPSTLGKPFVLSLSKDKQIKYSIQSISTLMVRQAHHERGNSQVIWYLERLFSTVTTEVEPTIINLLGEQSKNYTRVIISFLPCNLIFTRLEND